MLLRKSLFIIYLVGALSVAAGTLLFAQVNRIPTRANPVPDAVQDETVKMQVKLVHSQKILEGLVSRDFEQIQRAATGLREISLTPIPDLDRAGDSTDEQVYEYFRMEFARLAGKLERHARDREPEATAYVYQNLTDTCIACHDYIRDYSGVR